MIETLQRLTIAFAVMLSVAGAVRDWSQEEPSVAADYYQQTPVCGTIEAEYTAMGDYEVSYAEYPALDVLIKQYKVWYPSALEEGSQEWPIVVMANGTGVPASRYEPIFQHLASWGFVVIGNEQQASWQGDGSEGALELLIRLNEDPESAFYQKLDLECVGAAGHSQGAIGAINGTGEGVVFIDGSIPHPTLGPIREPIRVEFRGSRIVDISGGEEAEALKKVLEGANDPEHAYFMGEIGLGMNPACSLNGRMLEDEGCAGTIHFGIGDDRSFGGNNVCAQHIDLIFKAPTVRVDGRLVMQDGKVVD